MDKKEVSDTLGAAKIYLQRLKCLDKELQVAEKQVDNTYLEAEQIINDTFSNLKDTIIKILIGRRQNLIDQAQKVIERLIKYQINRHNFVCRLEKKV